MPKIKILAADTWFSKCVREAADWTCQRCGAQHDEKSTGLHNMHYHTRGKWGVRFDPMNSAAGCYGCHSYLDSNPHEKIKWFTDYFGEGAIGIINEKAQKPAYGFKKQLKEISKHYREEYKRLKQLRAEGVTGKLEVIGYE